MKNMPMDAFNHNIVTINQKLKTLETNRGLIRGYNAIVTWNATCMDIHHLLTRAYTFALNMDVYESVAVTLYELQKRLEHLPYVPDIRSLTRAQNLLALSPYIIVTEDVKSDTEETPELQRITVLDNKGQITFDQDFYQSHAHSNVLPSWDDPSTKQNATMSVPIAQIWDNLTKTLSGHYILAYDLTLAQTQLEVTAYRFQLPIPILIGESILDLYFGYIGTSESEVTTLILKTINEHLGSPFSQQASHTAKEKAIRINHTLQCIANGTLAIPSVTGESL